MVDTSAEASNDKNFPAHVRNYDGFLRMLKMSTIITVIVTAVVVYIIAN